MVVELALLPGRLNLADNGFTREDEEELYDLQLRDVLENTREYLDNLDFMTPYYVYWKNYSHPTPTIPHRFVKEKE